MDRKQFVSKAGRISILLVMASLVLLFARRRQLTESAKCGLEAGCEGCEKAGTCSLKSRGVK